MNRTLSLLIVLLFFTGSLFPVSAAGKRTGAKTGANRNKEFLPYRNLLPNGEMEADEDLNNVPDGWELYSWLPEGQEFLRQAVLRYLDLSFPEIGLSMENRRAFLGERSVKMFTPSGKIGPGMWTTIPLSPGLYTLNLVARSAGSDSRHVATFLGRGGKLTQVDRRWRWIHHSEEILYATPESVVQINDWTFREGGIFVDHISLTKVPFDVAYEKEVEFVNGENEYVIEISNLPNDIIPIGANLELREPAGTLIRKNAELDVTEQNSSFTFTVYTEVDGDYSISVELYNPRTTSILFSDDSIRGHLRSEPVEYSGRDVEQIRHTEIGEDFFPVGMSIRGYELDALEGKGMNTILLKEPVLEDIEEMLPKASGMGLRVILEIDATDSTHLDETERALVELSEDSKTVIGYSLLSGWGSGEGKKNALRNVSTEIREMAPQSVIFLRNYLPGTLDALVMRSVDALFVDPFPITIPSKPIYTIADWLDGARENSGPDTKFIAVVQAFAGWPFAKRAPTVPEMRALSKLALNHGADGVIFHTFSGDFPHFDDPVASNWDVRRIKELWSGIEDLVREVTEFHDRFGKPFAIDLPVSFVPGDALDLAFFASGDSMFVQVINVMPTDVSLRSVSPFYHEMDSICIVLTDSAIVCGEGFFEDDLPAFGTRIYSLPDFVTPSEPIAN